MNSRWSEVVKFAKVVGKHQNSLRYQIRIFSESCDAREKFTVLVMGEWAPVIAVKLLRN